MGFSSVWVYDHHEWRSMAGAPWLTAVPVLAAIAARTSRVRIGTMVATPNLHHPVAFAKEAVALDRISGGRLTLGLGAGSARSDAGVIGPVVESAAERATRFEEWVGALDRLLRSRGRVPLAGPHFTSEGSLMAPGPVQRPRPPFVVASTGARGMGLVARVADAWVSLDDPHGRSETVADAAGALAEQVRRIEGACMDAGRDPATLGRVLLTGMGPNRPLASVAALTETLDRARALGFDEVILHEPRSRDPHAGDPRVLERAVALAAG